MDQATRFGIRSLKVRGHFPNLRSMLWSLTARPEKLAKPPRELRGYRPPVVEYELSSMKPGESARIDVREIDAALLCRKDADTAAEYLSWILASREGDASAGARLDAALEGRFRELAARPGDVRCSESLSVIPSTSAGTYSEEAISHKGAILLKLSQLGHPVPDFVILGAQAYRDRESKLESCLEEALGNLEKLTFQKLAGPGDPLVFAVRCAMPCYYPGVMPTYLNAGITESAVAALSRTFGPGVANRMFLNNLGNILAALDPKSFDDVLGGGAPDPAGTAALVDRIAGIVRQKDRRLLEDAFYQTAFLVKQAYAEYEENLDLLLALSRGVRHYPSIILQKMVCTVREDDAHAGVLFSRHPTTGTGMQLQTARNVFGEAIMTGTVAADETNFEDREAIRESFPAVYHFVPHLEDLEREFETPVTLEFAVESTGKHQFFALLQLDGTGLTGRAAFISVVDMHQAGILSRKRVTQLIQPYHVKQIESDTIDPASWKALDLFCRGVAVLPRGAISARTYFSADRALEGKKQGEKVCLCKMRFTPNDTLVMREMDALVSLTPAALHVVTICQNFGVPALLDLEKDGAVLEGGDALRNSRGEGIREGEWVTLSSRRRSLFRGKAHYVQARLLRFMRGEGVKFEKDERKAFEAMAYAYRYYHQLVRGINAEQVATLKEVIRLINLDLRGESEEAVRLLLGWYDSHETAYMEEVLRSEMGDHLNQHRIFDMLTEDRKIRFFKAAVAKCYREKISGYVAGAFMLGRFLSSGQPVAFWRPFAPREIALLVNEWVLFEKYLQVLTEMGERRVLRARTKILSEGLPEVRLHAGSVAVLVPLKLCGVSLDSVLQETPDWCDPQVREVAAILKRPYREFFRFDEPWSVDRLKKLCAEAGMPVPGPDDA